MLSLAQEYQRIGHRVTLYTFLFSPTDCYTELFDGLEVVALGEYPSSLNYFYDRIQENVVSKKLAHLIRKDTDILNPHDGVSYKVAYYFKKAVKDAHSVWTMHDMPTKIFSCLVGQEVYPYRRTGLLKKFFYFLADKYEVIKFIRHQDGIIVLDNRDKDLARKYFYKNASVVRNGIDIEKFPYFTPGASMVTKTKILMNGIFFPHRRFEDGIRALKILRDKQYDVRLCIVGDYRSHPPYYQMVRGLVTELGLDTVTKFSGAVSEDDMASSYKDNDIFVFPNHLQSWGLAVFEAMAAGMPVVVSTSAGASELLTNNENALLVNPKSPDQISAAIERLINDPALLVKLSKKGREFVADNISWRRCAEHTLGVFKRTLGI